MAQVHQGLFASDPFTQVGFTHFTSSNPALGTECHSRNFKIADVFFTPSDKLLLRPAWEENRRTDRWGVVNVQSCADDYWETSLKSTLASAQLSSTKLQFKAGGDERNGEVSEGTNNVYHSTSWPDIVENDYIVRLLRAQMREYENMLSTM